MSASLSPNGVPRFGASGVEQAMKFNAKPVGPSLDHVMAQQLSSSGTLLLLNTSR
jgi:hypothetical protein